ncbi:hypothetical protein [Novosphingobium sp. Gsoil 351]|uniref:hypothetical protein n=1 Tax=Novosphingobium sp. Gsoil 351 TaxID=2675225 RepID=UPI001E531177|nr:hypothetical protein [Novosphingobium sp. Gsoil 351]
MLGAGALGAVAAGLNGLSGPASARNRLVTLVEESAIPESRQFVSAFAASGTTARIIRIDRSLGGLLHELEDTAGLIVGLTSDPVAMIASQLLVERGANPRLTWKHDYALGQWHHQTEGAPRLLKNATLAWPVAVAHEVRDAIGGKSERRPNTCDSGTCALAPSSPGMLVSWAYEIGGVQP